jgi:hypothetical protein
MSEKRDNVEVRLHNDGTLDEIVITDHADRCIMHLEQMDDHYYWMRVYGITQDLVVHIGATIGTVTEYVTDEKGIITGTRPLEGQPKVWANYEWEDSLDERSERLAAPNVQRRQQVASLVGTYGVGALLGEIVDIVGLSGRNEEHEVRLTEELREIKDRFMDNMKGYWRRRLDEWMKSSREERKSYNAD